MSPAIDHPKTEWHKSSASEAPDPGGIMSERRATPSRNAWATSSESATYYFDAFGLHAELFISSISRWSQTTRGFTGQEELDFGLVHLNGRVYDPLAGRMMSADPMVPDPLNRQAWDDGGWRLHSEHAACRSLAWMTAQAPS